MNPLTLWKAASLLQRAGAIIGILLTLVAVWKVFWWQYDKGVIEKHEEKVTETVASQSASASASASATVAETKSKVEKGNDDARKAASGSTDPLKSGLDRLHKGKGPANPAPR